MLMLRIKRRLILKAIGVLQRFRVVWYGLLSSSQVIGDLRRLQPVQVVGLGSVSCGENVKIGVYPSPGFLSSYAYIEARNPSAKVSIGSGTWINNGFVCIAEHSSISIGSNCLIGANVEILDSDFHGLALHERGVSRPGWSASVVLEDNVFLGSNVRILKGVRIGMGSVIANSAVVICDIPPMTIAGGVPAKVLRAVE